MWEAHLLIRIRDLAHGLLHAVAHLVLALQLRRVRTSTSRMIWDVEGMLSSISGGALLEREPAWLDTPRVLSSSLRCSSICSS